MSRTQLHLFFSPQRTCASPLCRHSCRVVFTRSPCNSCLSPKGIPNGSKNVCYNHSAAIHRVTLHGTGSGVCTSRITKLLHEQGGTQQGTKCTCIKSIGTKPEEQVQHYLKPTTAVGDTRTNRSASSYSLAVHSCMGTAVCSQHAAPGH